MATPEHKLTGKSTDEPAEQSSSGAGAEALVDKDQSSLPGGVAHAGSPTEPSRPAGAERTASSAELAPTGTGAEGLDAPAASGQAGAGANLPASATGANPRASTTGANPRASTTGADQPSSGSAADLSASGSGGYKIHIPMYEGPLDLLLDLIKTQRMSIHDIRISEITAQYLDYLHKLEELDVDVSAEFIYMAATLIYIKSKMLLPPDPLASPEEQAADPRADLVQRLVEHEKFKSAAQILYQKQQIEENVWSKPDKTLYQDPGTEGELVVSLVDLVKVFQQVLGRRKETVRIELHHEQFTVAQMIVQLRAQIIASVENAVNLIQFFEACPSRHAMIVAFLAVLEMVKLQAVALVQEQMFGDILVKKGKSFDVVFDENGAIRMVDEEYR